MVTLAAGLLSSPRRDDKAALPEANGGERIRISDRLEFEPIAFRFALDVAGRQTAATQNVQQRRTGFECVLPVSSDLDVLWGRDSLFFLTRGGRASEVAIADVATPAAVADDGERLYVAADGRLLVLDHHGRVVASVGEAQGLPRFAYGAVQLQLIAPGVLLIAVERDPRDKIPGTWVGRIDLDATAHPHVTTVVDARHRINPTNVFGDLITRVDVPFRCDWPMVDFTGSDGHRLIYIARSTVPLVIDPADWSVRPFPARTAFDDNFPVLHAGIDESASDRGTLYVADDEDDFLSYTRDPATGRFTRVQPTTDRSHGGGRGIASLLIYDGWLYYLGINRWFRERLDTGRREALSEGRALFRLGLYGPWRLVHSQQLGLIVTNERRIYRVIIDGKAVP